ncbi:hypothetical protein BGW41_001869 [Actinomortierella wolfii]|nr:hypothetical protein BGW41_001869 [Actinomortierella wolfii]
MLLNDLPDEILLRIFSYLLDEDSYSPEVIDPVRESNETSSPPLFNLDPIAAPESCSEGSTGLKKNNKRPKKTGRKTILACPAARTLCRLCCCSKRLNHIASANQLWQPLTLTKFPNRHWAETDPKKLELVRVQRERQQKMTDGNQPTKSKSELGAVNSQDNDVKRDGDDEDLDVNSNIEGTGDGAARKKFYSRREQRAFRRKFANLDPMLEYTPLLWTNTYWSWKRTYYGDCRFLEAQEVATPNRIDQSVHKKKSEPTKKNDGEKGSKADVRDMCSRCWRPLKSCICSALPQHVYCNCRVRIVILQHPRCQVSIGTIRILKTCFKYCDIFIGKDFSAGIHPELDKILDDPNCTPLLLYPSHNAVDICHFAAKQAQRDPSSTANATRADRNPKNNNSSDTSVPARFFCDDCVHHQHQHHETSGQAYSYKTIIALDGSWSHAKILYRFNPRLQQLVSVHFPQPPPSVYHVLKSEPKESYTSTVEAVGQAVALLGWSSSSPLSQKSSTQHDAPSATTESSDDAGLLIEDLIRPLRKLIGIQDAFQLHPSR